MDEKKQINSKLQQKKGNRKSKAVKDGVDLSESYLQSSHGSEIGAEKWGRNESLYTSEGRRIRY